MYGAYKYQNLWRGCIGAWCPSQDNSRSTLLTDFSGYGRKGTLTNMDPGTDWVASQNKIALDFDGTNDYVTMGNLTFIDNVPQLSLCYWAKKVASTSMIIVGQGTSTTFRSWVWNYTDKRTYYIIANTSNSYFYGPVRDDALWHHYTMVFNGNATGNSERGKGYFDGLIDTVTYVGTLPSSTATHSSPFDIAKDGVNSLYSTGVIDDVRVYNRALQPSEVQQLASRRGIAFDRNRHRVGRMNKNKSGANMMIGVCG